MDPRGPTDAKTPPPSSSPPGKREPASPLTEDPQVTYLYQKYAQEIPDASELSAQNVAEARALLDSGQLDAPDAIQRTAHALLTLGP